MNIIDFSLLLICCLFSVYALAAAVECAIASKIVLHDKKSTSLFTPLWEITNVFLVFGFTALGMLFNNVLPSVSKNLIGLLSVAIVAILIRASLVLSVFYVKDKNKISRWLTWLFALCTYLIPLSFAAAGVYFLSGKMFWGSAFGWTLMLSAAVGLPAVGLTYVDRHTSDKNRQTSQLLFVLWLLCVGSLIPTAAKHIVGYDGKWPLAVMVLGSLMGLLVLFVQRLTGSSAKVWMYAFGLYVAVIPLLGWNDRPYLIHGNLSLSSAYGAQAYGSVVAVGLAIMTPIIAAGLYMFVKLFSGLVKN